MNKLLSIGLLCGLLVGAAGTAIITWYFLSSSEPSTVFSPSAVCDVMPLGEPTRPDPGYFTMRFVAYGDVDADDDIPCGMLPNATIAIISEKGIYSASNAEEENLFSWWSAVGGNELGIERFIPPGVRVKSTAEKLLNAPARFITTGSEGTAEMVIPYDPEDDSYSLCAISSTGDLIAGCLHDFSLRKIDDHITVYVYFTHGHAIIEKDNSDRYQQFLNSSGAVWAPVTVAFTATSNDDIEPSQRAKNRKIAIIGGPNVNAWWTDVSDNGVYPLDTARVSVSSETLAHDWVNLVITDRNGLAETVLSPGDYLICETTLRGFISQPHLSTCLYEHLTSGEYEFEINYWWGNNFATIARIS